MYCAIIGDIIESRKINNREMAQLQLIEILKKINEIFSDEIVAKFVITIGDEFQGLLKSPARLFEIIDFIKMNYYPNEIRFGIGFGNITTKINSEMAIGADGPAFYAARKAIEAVKLNEKRKERAEINIMFIDSVENNQIEYDLINSTLSLCRFIENRWSDKQREVILKLMNSNASQSELASDMGIAQSSIQRRIDASGYYVYTESRNCLKKYVLKLWEGNDE